MPLHRKPTVKELAGILAVPTGYVYQALRNQGWTIDTLNVDIRLIKYRIEHTPLNKWLNFRVYGHGTGVVREVLRKATPKSLANTMAVVARKYKKAYTDVSTQVREHLVTLVLEGWQTRNAAKLLYIYEATGIEPKYLLK